MNSQVFFTDLRATDAQSLLQKIVHLIEKAGLKKVVKKRGLTAIKIHFGERGNTAFIRPLLVRPVVDAVKQAGGKPFLTDANTLYVGTRGNAVDHLTTAILNGFSPSVVDAPLIIADGIDGRDDVVVPLGLKLCHEAYVGSAIAKADTLISLAHFKLHEAAGFGGAIKNVGMGAASRRGKMAQHSEVAPEIYVKKCIGCGTCMEQCAHGAMSLVDRPEDAPRPFPEAKKVIHIDEKLCVGCAGCIHSCPQEALGINWKTDLPRFMERMVEYTVGALKGKEKRSLFVNFLTQISPACDCHSYADAPIVADIGILASRDPVAIDQASMDLVNAQPPLHSSCIKDSPYKDSDKVKAVYPHIDWQHQLDYAEEVGLGSKSYELIRL
ncbi:DUF362 domain-containing protein [Desulforhabdus amnigena]|jgi:uncharacterized Fe-S center protein|uniref:4Fe-4S ferredoxin n=1 Tax=Desulforhabdus amnigena TaxID=40218 RepID=A0A9W6D406_9BACT|nr:DUF362 domain-containing protein [Desulforhabdus amnigena]NLJ27970.1 DUF362 domain-containing protein [Deltaproteobacteria bacterium]GLI33745.1 4Fe-4S ferredoxin [Desulforhabdus amnigena]